MTHILYRHVGVKCVGLFHNLTCFPDSFSGILTPMIYPERFMQTGLYIKKVHPDTS